MREATVLLRCADVIETDRRVLIAGVGLGGFASLLLELALIGSCCSNTSLFSL